MNEDNIWKDDHIGRKEDAELLIRFLQSQLEFKARLNQERTYVLNIDSPWGGGKTFFLKNLHAELRSQGFTSVYVDSWASDYSDDPLIAVFSSIKAELEGAAADRGRLEQFRAKVGPIKKSIGAIAIKAAGGAAEQAIKKMIGEGAAESILEATGVSIMQSIGDRMVDSFEEKLKAVDQFKLQLEELGKIVLSETRASAIYVLIDELDRCRPDYSVKLLERMKHLFSVDGYVFITATDTEQLSYSISHAYGDGFDSARYLRRFFQRTYRFPPRKLGQFVRSRFVRLGLQEGDFNSPPGASAVEFMATAFSYAGCQLRDIEQIMERLQTFRAIWPYSPLKIELVYLLPILHEEILSSALEKGGSDIRSCPVNFPRWNERTGVQDQISRPVGDVVRAFDQYGTDLFANWTWQSGAIEDWITISFAEERRIIHNNSFRRGVPVPSVLQEYVDLATQVSFFDG